MPEFRTAAEVVFGVDLLGLALERVAALGIGRRGVAVVAAALGIDDVAAEPDLPSVFALQIEAGPGRSRGPRSMRSSSLLLRSSSLLCPSSAKVTLGARTRTTAQAAVTNQDPRMVPLLPRDNWRCRQLADTGNRSASSCRANDPWQARSPSDRRRAFSTMQTPRAARPVRSPRTPRTRSPNSPPRWWSRPRGNALAPPRAPPSVPAGTPHTYRVSAEPTRYLIFLTPRLDRLIARLHAPIRPVRTARHARRIRHRAGGIDCMGPGLHSRTVAADVRRGGGAGGTAVACTLCPRSPG